jgi:hypothetical protein
MVELGAAGLDVLGPFSGSLKEFRKILGNV